MLGHSWMKLILNHYKWPFNSERVWMAPGWLVPKDVFAHLTHGVRYVWKNLFNWEGILVGLAQRQWKRSFQEFLRDSGVQSRAWRGKWDFKLSKGMSETNTSILKGLPFYIAADVVCLHWLSFYGNRANGWILQFRVCADWMLLVVIRLNVRWGRDGGASWRCIARWCLLVLSDKSYLWVGCTWTLQVEWTKQVENFLFTSEFQSWGHASEKHGGLTDL